MNNIPLDEEEGLDIMELVKQLWSGRKTVIKWTCAFIVLGLVAALTMKRTYAVSTVMVPQVSSKNSSLSSLASLAGFDLGTTVNGSDISPLIYPQIVSSVTFLRELLYTPTHFADVDRPVSFYTYATEIAKPSVIDIIKQYTIGLPGVILKAIRPKKEPIVLPTDGAAVSDPQAKPRPRPVVITEDEEILLKYIAKTVGLAVDKKEGYITLFVKGVEPIQTAELAMKAQQLLQDEITRFRIEKSQNELDYIQARYDEAKAEAESYQDQLARIIDRSQGITTTKDRIERDRIQTKYTIANSIYSELAKQLEQAKMQVKKDTPTFTIVQPVTVPIKAANSRAKTLIVWTFFGFVLGCGIVLGRNYWPKLKEMLN